VVHSVAAVPPEQKAVCTCPVAVAIAEVAGFHRVAVVVAANLACYILLAEVGDVA